MYTQQQVYHKTEEIKMKKARKAGFVGFEYNIELITSDHYTGEIKERTVVHNSIVNSGLERIAKLINGVSSTNFLAIAIGTGDTAVDFTDTALVTEVARAEATTLTYEADYKSKFSKLFTFGSGVSYTIKEVGVFDNSSSGGVMLNRALDAGKAVDSDTDLTVTITITVARA